MGAFVGALILTFFNKTKDKQHLNRRYDSESGTTIKRTQPMAGFLLLGVLSAIAHKGPPCWQHHHHRGLRLFLHHNQRFDIALFFNHQ